MKKTIFNVLLFATGAAVGSVVTWKVVKARYEQEMRAEIDAFKKDFLHCMREESSNEGPYEDDEWEVDDDEDDDEDGMNTYQSLAHRYSQSGDYTENDGKGAGDEEVPYINGPYVITPEDFGDGNYDHSLYSLTYYSDGVLSNDWYEKLDIEETIGEDSLEHFGDYAEDIVHVRNERMDADYEVVRDPRRYADLIANDPLMNMHAN